MRVVTLLAALVWLALAGLVPAFAEKRVALVIGNDAYPNLPADEQLTRAVNDMNAVATGLEKIGFSVIKAGNADRATMLAKLDELATRLEPGDIALFFYAGHGVAIEGTNYLLPADSPAGGSRQLVRGTAIAEADIVDALSEREVKTAIVVLDACRNNPFSGMGTRAVGGTRGLTRLAAEPKGVFGIYSAGIGQTALDRLGDNDTDPNSVFTRIFIKELTEEGGNLIDIAYRLQKEVEELAATVGHEQRPSYYDQARGRDITLTDIPTKPEDKAPPEFVAAIETAAAAKAAPAGGAATAAAPAAAPDCSLAAEHFKAAREIGTREALESHIAFFPACPFAPLAHEALAKLGNGAPVVATAPTGIAGRTTGPDAAPSAAAPPPGSVFATFHAPRNRVNGVAVSPDGKLVAGASHDAAVRIWDVASEDLVHTFRGLGKPAYSVAFSPDGKTLAAGLWNHTIRLWDVESGKLLHTLKGHRDEVYGIAFSPDGKTLASGSEDKTIHFWDVASGAPIRTLKGHGDTITSLSFSPDGKTLASASHDKLIRLWDVATGAAQRPLGEHDGLVYGVAFSPDGKMIASGADDRLVRLWDAGTGATVHDLKGHSDEVYAVAFSPDGTLLASASEDKTVIVWDVATGRSLATLKGHPGIIQAVAFFPDGLRLASGARDRTIRLWSLGEKGALAAR